MKLYAFALYLLVVGLASGQTVQNAGFEVPVLSTGSWLYDPPAGGIWAGNLQWGIANGSGAWGSGGHSGNQYAFVQKDGDMAQTVPGFVVGGQYQVSFWMVCRNGNAGANTPNPITISVNGSPLGTFTPPQDSTWRQYTTVTFVASANSLSISFSGPANPQPDRTSLIDDVSVVVIGGHIAPWPMERQDRWGDAFAVIGPDPSTFTTPWISNKLAHNFPVSHGPSLNSDGMGYFGDWVDNRVYKFNYSTGTVLGSFFTNSFTQSTPAIAGGVIVCGADQFLFGVDTSTMDYDWFKSSFGYTGGSAIIGPDGNAVIAGTAGGTAYKLIPLTGVPIWTHGGLGTPRGSMVFTRDDSKVICANGNSVTAMNYGTGATVWSVNFPAAMYSPACAMNGTILVGSDNGTVYDLNPVDGSTVWSFTTLGQIEGAAAFSPDGTVAYVPSFDYRIYALRVADGTRLWDYTTSLFCQTPPSVGIDGRIYEHNKAGDLYCISPAGTLIWQVHLNGESRGPMTIGPDGSLYVGYTGNNDSGLAIIRLQPIDLEPDSFTIDHGSLVSGGLSDVFLSDNNYLVVQQAPVPSPLISPVRVIFTTRLGYFPLTQITLTVQAHASASGLTRYTELWNNSTNNWDVVASALEGTTDTTAVTTVSNAGPYTDGGGQVKERVRWTPTRPIPSPNWTTSINYIHFDAVPQFQP